MDSTIIAALIGVIGILIGALLGGYVSWLITKRDTEHTILATFTLNRIQEFNKAAANFRAAFIDAVIFLKFDQPDTDNSMSDVHVNDFLNNFTVQHLQAIIKFKPFLSKGERTSLDRAWDEYCHPEGKPKDKYEKRDFVFNGYYHIEEASGEEAAKKIALGKINNLLEFAKFR